jgi:hypothetical protein
MTDTGLKYHGEEYTAQVMATAGLLRDALGNTEFDVGVNALITVLAECGKHSDMGEKEFLIMLVVQAQHLMSNMVVVDPSRMN